MQKNCKVGFSKTANSTVVFGDPQSVWEDKQAKSIAYFCKNKPVHVDRKLIIQLKEIAANSGSKNVRLCLHESPQALFHDMLILEHKDKFYRAHKHLTKGESFHLIEGSMAVFTFREDGSIADVCVLSCNDNFIYRVGQDMYHAVMPLSDLVIYHEAKPGPFLPDTDSIYPAWAPCGDNPKEVEEYKTRLMAVLKKK